MRASSDSVGPPAGGLGGQSGPVWSEGDLTQSPHQHAQKQERVGRMFAAISRSYDLNNRLHSFGLDQAWRRHVVRAVKTRAHEHVLDVACGTGDLTRLFAQGVGASAPAAKVVGLDYTDAMLDIAREKRSHPTDAGIEYVQGDAMALSFADASFDVVSIAFGIRNVQDPALAVREFFRVLRPGGRLAVLEFDRPRNPIVRFGNDLYTKRIMPVTATLISRDRSGAYRYLPKSVDTFLDRDALGGLIKASGFTSLTQRALTMGVCVCHVGQKPG
jgi:demethylmenaquinone methyltransferase/2-methoxy-6-polyprenyl-1,4-benzoquinol methylase